MVVNVQSRFDFGKDQKKDIVKEQTSAEALKKSSNIALEKGSFKFFDKKTLFLAGEKSEYITNGEIPLIKKHFPESSIQTIPNVGHWLHAESPDVFYELVMNFLK